MKTINKIIAFSISPVYILICAAFILNTLRDKLPLLNTFIIVSVVFISLILIIALIIKNPTYENFKYISLTSFLLSYTVIIFLSRNDYIYSFAFVILSVYVLYFDLKLIGVAVTYFIIVNLISVCASLFTSHMPTGHELDVTSLFIQISTIITFGFITYTLTKYSNEINAEKLNIIEEKKNKKEDLLEQILLTANQLKVNITKGTSLIHTLNNKNNESNTLVKTLEDNTVFSNNCINNQEKTCEDIGTLINKIVKDIDITIATTNEAVIELETSYNQMHSLSSKSNEIISQNYSVMDSINRFINKTAEVKKLTIDIIDILSQTNSLAICASIESARAGEAGKGFSVVADEIRLLSEQTKSLTNDITDVVAFLEEQAKQTSEVVINVVNAVFQENATISSSIGYFKEIEQNINELSMDMSAILNNTNEIVTFNDTINKHINELKESNMTFEKNSYDAIIINMDYDTKSKNTKEIMDKLLESAESLISYI